MKNSNIPAVKLYGLQFFYNISQVALCSYMCIEALVQAYRNVSNQTHVHYIESVVGAVAFT